MNKVQALNRLMLLIIAPFIGLFIWLLNVNLSIEVPNLVNSVEYTPVELHTSDLEAKLDEVNLKVTNTKPLIDQYKPLYEQSAIEIKHMLDIAAASRSMPESIVDQRITSKLGRTVRHESSDNLDLKLFVLNENKYKGYAMKVKLKTDNAMQLVLSKDKLGELETTQQAVSRLGAAAGVNAGGYVENKSDALPNGTIFLNGQYLNGPATVSNDSIFIGMNNKRQLIGGSYSNQAEIDQLSPLFGITSGPILVQEGVKATIPSHLEPTTKRSARTVIANYHDDQLLFLVIDGDDNNKQAGATLEELQDKLISLGVKDAYNLEGGGSSSLVFNNEMMNLPAEGKAKPVATHFVFFK
jgi:Phosphodiester glycosidase